MIVPFTCVYFVAGAIVRRQNTFKIYQLSGEKRIQRKPGILKNVEIKEKYLNF